MNAILPGSSQPGRLQQMQKGAQKASQLPPFSPAQRHPWAPHGLSARSPNPTRRLESGQRKLPTFPAKALSGMNEEAGGSGGGQLLPTMATSGTSLTLPLGLLPVLLMHY